MNNQPVATEKVDEKSNVSLKSEDYSKLKLSTRKLLSLIDEIEKKVLFTHKEITVKEHVEKIDPPIDETVKEIAPDANSLNLSSCGHYPKAESEEHTLSDLVKLEAAIRHTDASTLLKDEDTDCSIYKRLTKVCNCLNKTTYNDLIMHFNTDIKYFASSHGNIIKNLRVVKQFLYMGVEHTRNALLFLNECLTTPTVGEKIEIIQGCSHADICNVFEHGSLPRVCIDFTLRDPAFGDTYTQSLASQFLYKMSEIEEGKRYLNYNTKIVHDIQQILMKKTDKLDPYVENILLSTMKLLHPQLIELSSECFDYNPIQEELCNNAIQSLLLCREYMTIDEILSQLNFIYIASKAKNKVPELYLKLKVVINLLKEILLNWDNKEINSVISKIFSNILSRLKKERFVQFETVKQSSASNITRKRNPVKSTPKYKNPPIHMDARSPPTRLTKYKTNTRILKSRVKNSSENNERAVSKWIP